MTDTVDVADNAPESVTVMRYWYVPALLKVAIVLDAAFEPFTLSVVVDAPAGRLSSLHVKVRFPMPASSVATTRRVEVVLVTTAGVEVAEEMVGA